MQDISGHIDTIAISYLAIADSPDLMLYWNLTTFFYISCAVAATLTLS